MISFNFNADFEDGAQHECTGASDASLARSRRRLLRRRLHSHSGRRTRPNRRILRRRRQSQGIVSWRKNLEFGLLTDRRTDGRTPISPIEVVAHDLIGISFNAISKTFTII